VLLTTALIVDQVVGPSPSPGGETGRAPDERAAALGQATSRLVVGRPQPLRSVSDHIG
jgi:hypothetical protein